MKYLFFLFFFGCTLSDVNKTTSADSMFFFVPKEKKELFENGYKFSSNNIFSKSDKDTVEYIDIINIDSGQFVKDIHIKKINKQDISSLISFISNNADSALLKLNNALLIRQDGIVFLVQHGFTRLGKGYRFVYRNFKVKKDKIISINYLKEQLSFSNVSDREPIVKALEYLDKGWRSYSVDNRDSTLYDETVPTSQEKN